MSKIKPPPVFKYKVEKFQQVNVHNGNPTVTKYRLAVAHANRFITEWHYIELGDFSKIYSTRLTNSLDGFVYNSLEAVANAKKAFTEHERRAYDSISEKRIETVETGIINI